MGLFNKMDSRREFKITTKYSWVSNSVLFGLWSLKVKIFSKCFTLSPSFFWLLPSLARMPTLKTHWLLHGNPATLHRPSDANLERFINVQCIRAPCPPIRETRNCLLTPKLEGCPHCAPCKLLCKKGLHCVCGKCIGVPVPVPVVHQHAIPEPGRNWNYWSRCWDFKASRVRKR